MFDLNTYTHTLLTSHVKESKVKETWNTVEIFYNEQKISTLWSITAVK